VYELPQRETFDPLHFDDGISTLLTLYPYFVVEVESVYKIRTKFRPSGLQGLIAPVNFNLVCQEESQSPQLLVDLNL
jgi:hypothetical protein